MLPTNYKPPNSGGPSAEWLSSAAVARYFGVSRQLASHWDKRGWLPAATVLPDGRKAWNIADLRAFLASADLAGPVRRRLPSNALAASEGATQ